MLWKILHNFLIKRRENFSKTLYPPSPPISHPTHHAPPPTPIPTHPQPTLPPPTHPHPHPTPNLASPSTPHNVRLNYIFFKKIFYTH